MTIPVINAIPDAIAITIARPVAVDIAVERRLFGLPLTKVNMLDGSERSVSAR
jgi:hypothetical protein